LIVARPPRWNKKDLRKRVFLFQPRAPMYFRPSFEVVKNVFALVRLRSNMAFYEAYEHQIGSRIYSVGGIGLKRSH
jgi:hypothetical protein